MNLARMLALPRRALYASAAGIVLLVLCAFLAFSLFVPIDSQNPFSVAFRVEQGQGSWRIANQLRQQGLIRSPAAFTFFAFFTGRAFHLQSGDYLFTPGMNAHAILRSIAKGDVVRETLTVREGWSLKNIAQELEERGIASQNEFYAITGYPGIDLRHSANSPKAKDFSGEFAFLQNKPEHVSLEGYLFPDTYRITAHQDPEDLVRRMLSNFEKKITPAIRAEIASQEKSLFEVLTMASLIEKEVRSLKDKKLVSGVLWKRLARGMRLQVDAAIVYIREGNYYKVTYEELKIDSPYNTYEHDGLPPGPISNPGLESVEAALHPIESPYWFYLSPSPNTTVFSETFEQHESAIDRHLLMTPVEDEIHR